MEENPFYIHYLNQTGRGHTYYRSGFPIQSGRGVFGALWTFLRPLLTSGAKSLATQAVVSGSQILKDAVTNKNNESVSDITRRHAGEAIRNLGEKLATKVQGGRGKRRYKQARKPPAKKPTARQKASSCSRRRTRVPYLPDIRDVFSP